MQRFIGLVLALVVSAQNKEGVVLAKVPEGCQVVARSLRFARNGSKVAFVVSKGAKYHPVVGAAMGDEYDTVSPPVMQPSGEHIAFRALTLDRNKNEHWTLVYDNKSIASDDWVGEVALAPTDGTPAYWLSHGRINNADGSLSHGAMTLVFGKSKTKKWQATDEQIPPCFTADGKRVISVATKGGDTSILTFDSKGKESKLELGGPTVIEAVFSADGTVVAHSDSNRPRDIPNPQRIYTFSVWRAEPENPSEAMLNALSAAYPSAGSPVISADGAHVAYKIESKGKFGVAIDASKDAKYEFDFVDELSWSPDGTQLAYLACNGCTLDQRGGIEVLAGTKAKGGKWIVVHGTERSSAYDEACEPSWSPNGKKFAYAARTDGKWRVFCGKKSSEPCDDIAGLVWADDGRSVSYGCRRGDELVWCKLAVE